MATRERFARIYTLVDWLNSEILIFEKFVLPGEEKDYKKIKEEAISLRDSLININNNLI